VQEDIKNLFEKTGVASRQELVARIFLDDYGPTSPSEPHSHPPVVWLGETPSAIRLGLVVPHSPDQGTASHRHSQ
jgi:hypothetical protein